MTEITPRLFECLIDRAQTEIPSDYVRRAPEVIIAGEDILRLQGIEKEAPCRRVVGCKGMAIFSSVHCMRLILSKFQRLAIAFFRSAAMGIFGPLNA